MTSTLEKKEVGIMIKLSLFHARLTAVDRQKNRSRLTSEADSPRLLHCNAPPPLSDYDDEDASSLSASEQWSGGTLGLSLTLQLTYISIFCTLQASLSCRGNLFYFGKLTQTVQDKALPTKWSASLFQRDQVESRWNYSPREISIVSLTPYSRCR